MFETISIIIFLGMIAVIALHAIICPCGPGPRWGVMDIVRKKVHIFSMLLLEQRLSLLGRLRKLALLLALLCFIILFITGFAPSLLFGVRLSGYLLMAHVTFAGVFIVCVAFVVLTWAGHFAFNEDNLNWLKRLTGTGDKPRCDIIVNNTTALKLCFWFVAVLTLPLAGSSVVSMLPIFGTHGQEVLFEIHRWCALAVSAGIFGYIYLMIREGFKKNS